MPRRRDASKVSIDSWAHICSFLHREPRKVFMLMCTVRGLRMSKEWWETYWRAHLIHLASKSKEPHWYLRCDPRPELYQSVLRLVYGMACARCGCRYNHTIHHAMRKRLCCVCIRDSYISSNVLYKVYGIDLHMIAVDYHNFVRHRGIRQYLCPKEVTRLSSHPLDLALRGLHKMVFLWKADIERLFDLSQKRKEQSHRLWHLNKIKAACKMRYAMEICKNRRHCVEQLHFNEIKRHASPVQLEKHLFIGCSPSKGLLPAYIRLEHAFRNILPLPLLADDEYDLRCAIDKLRLNPETLKAKVQE